MHKQFMGDFTFRDSASRQVQLFISSSISYIFLFTAVLRLSSLS